MSVERTMNCEAKMERLIAPRSIAVVGASEQQGAFGQRTLADLQHFNGHVFGVNPKYREVVGRSCVPSLRDLPEAPDCVAICVGRPLVEAALADAVAVGAGAVIVYASGYAETGLA